jgi:hypothetical protein
VSPKPGEGHPVSIEIYIGRRVLGRYVEQSGEWLAFSNDDDQVLGRYLTRQAAIAAIVASAKADT